MLWRRQWLSDRQRSVFAYEATYGDIVSVSASGAGGKFLKLTKKAKNSTFRVFLGEQYDKHRDLVVEPLRDRSGWVAECRTDQTMIAVVVEPPTLVYNFTADLQELEEHEAILGFELALDRHGLFD